MPLILAHLEYRGQQEKEFRIQCEINRIERERLRQIEEEQKARKEKEIKSFRELLTESNSWHQSVILNQYIEEVERRALIEESITEEKKEWLAWAKEKSEWFNPFIKKEDLILGNQDRNSFYAKLDISLGNR